MCVLRIKPFSFYPSTSVLILHPRDTSREVFEARRSHTCSRPCAFDEKKRAPLPKSRRTQNTHEIHSSPATATTSRRRATIHVSRVSAYSPASIDAGFVEIGLVQLSQSVYKKHECYTCTGTSTQYAHTWYRQAYRQD